MRRITTPQFYDYLLLAARLWLAFLLLTYGWGKLTDNQFGVSAQELNMPLKDLNLFRLSWYLADHQPFKAFIGVSQIITALLLIFNRTCIIGAFISIPIWANILVWDMTFMGLTSAFTWRISYYLILTFLIIWHRRDRIIAALRSIMSRTANRYVYPLWAYLLLPVFAALIESLVFLPRWISWLFSRH
jgi:uncharacterized membrane protein YphA (DoxX/SURF4 family)